MERVLHSMLASRVVLHIRAQAGDYLVLSDVQSWANWAKGKGRGTAGRADRHYRAITVQVCLWERLGNVRIEKMKGITTVKYSIYWDFVLRDGIGQGLGPYLRLLNGHWGRVNGT